MKIPEPKKLPSGAWRIQLQVNGKRRSITGSDKKTVIAKAAALKTGTKKATDAKGTLGAAIDSYIELRKNVLSPSTIRGYHNVRNNRMQDLMAVQIRNIDTRTIQSAVNNEARKFSPKTVKNAYGLIASVLEENDISVGRVRLPSIMPKERPFFEAEQVKDLIHDIRGDKYEAPILLALWLGMRRSEIMALSWEDVDFKREEIRIHKAILMDENDNMIISERTKTAASTRTLSCPQYILELIEPSKKKSGLVFEGYPITAIYDRVHRFCRERGIPNVGCHGLRHTNASIMLTAGVSDKVAMQRGGWSTNYTMKKIYQHIQSDAKAKAEEAINGYFEQAAK